MHHTKNKKGELKKMNDTLTINEQEKAVKITIRSETIKPIINAIKSYDPKFNINKFDKDSGLTLDIIHLLVQRYQEKLLNLIDDNVPSHYHETINNDDGIELINLLE